MTSTSASRPGQHRLCAARAASPLAGASQGAAGHPAWPDQAARPVVGIGAGGDPDVMARGLARAIGESFGQAVLVDNPSSATGHLCAGARVPH